MRARFFEAPDPRVTDKFLVAPWRGQGIRAFSTNKIVEEIRGQTLNRCLVQSSSPKHEIIASGDTSE